jgi:hypothetical protein
VLSASNLIFLAATKAAAGSSSSAWVTPTIVISIVALAVSLWTFFLSGRRARLDRQRKVFAEAFEAVMEYREYPFIVRRRDAEELTKERPRISGDLSGVLARINGFEARLRIEDPFVGQRYVELVDATRRVAGPKITEAWNTEPVAEDKEIHNPGWDFSELKADDDAYVRAVADHLHWLPGRAKLRQLMERKPPAAPARGALPKPPGNTGTGS